MTTMTSSSSSSSPSSSFRSMLPLRLTKPKHDMMGMLTSWMDNSSTLSLSSSNCQEDLATIDSLRREIAQGLGESKEGAYEEGLKIIEKLHTYYNYLLECEENGIVCSCDDDDDVVDDDDDDGRRRRRDLSSLSTFVALEWESALTSGTLQTSHSLEWERANIIWNLATLEAYQASKESRNSKPSWNKASKRLQNAASWLHQILILLQDQQSQELQQHYPDFSTTFIQFWQALLLAQAQQCIYESLLCVKRPMHVLAAKLAAAAVPLYNDVEMIVQKDNKTNKSSPASSYNNLALSQCSDLVETWTVFARAWGVYMSCKTEYHQSQIDRNKKLWGQEIARLDTAYQYADICNTICEATPTPALDKLRTIIDGTIKLLRDRIEIAERENTEQHKQPVPKRQELTEIRGEKLVKIDESLSKLLSSKNTEPIFQKKTVVLQIEQQSTTEPSMYQKKASPIPPNLQAYVKKFESEMNEIVIQIANATEELTESGKLSLAAVNLPHSFTAYKQEQSGGGLPDNLWQRVHSIQKENRIVQLKQDLWELRDAADLARTASQMTLSQLDSDIDSDRLFRQMNPTFQGHHAKEVQGTFRQSLANYDRLLSSAQEGDSVLFTRLEQLDTEPKYNLLQFSKSQLDCLLPSARGDPDPNITIDTQHLSYLLDKLSALFQEREELLNRIRKELKHYDIQGTLQSRVDPVIGSNQDYLEASKFAQKAFDGMIYEIQNNMDRQKELLGAIMIANEQFMTNRERTSASQSADSCIVMIEDAIEEIDELTNHLKEGNKFYNVVIPKLDTLKQQVGDISARLTVERLEYDDKARRVSQEWKDSLMAKNLSSESNDGSGATNPPTSAQNNERQSSDLNSSPLPPQQKNHHPTIGAAALQTTATSNVDDEKVATLVGMDFDPDKVVAALEKHNNNVDQALNELLSC
mmetsp:Transcript_8837/g.9774  ORF Transcript_8837/g.9774 Transcript_8837/m.9774 type:complete len:926 (+) Transcript_8837:101-2878(+)